jgi:uncharacterized protein (TIGR03435 family)
MGMRTKPSMLTGISLIPSLAIGAFAQSTPPAKPRFDVADIRANKSGITQDSLRVLPSGQFEARNLTMRQVLSFAYHVREQDITGGPGWLNDGRFDIVAKMPAETPEPTARLMLQNLLIDRMKLKTHMEQKVMSVYALVVGKGGQKFGPAARSGPENCVRSPDTDEQTHLTCTNISMAVLADHLPGLAPRYIDGRPVVDLTGLNGTYDFKLDWTIRPVEAANVAAGPTIFDAVEKELGLKIEDRKQPMPIVVIDSLERTPSEN